MSVVVKINELNINLKPQIKEVLQIIGQQCAKEISQRSPVRTGVYAAGWTSKLTNNDETVTVYNNGKNSSLTHLLELGHLTRGNTWVPPQEHIRPTYNKYQKVYLDSLMQIKVGGNLDGK